MEGYALTALSAIVVTGVGAWLTFGRNTLTKKEHDGYCSKAQELVMTHIVYLKEGQGRLENKVDEALEVLHKMNGDK